MLPRRLAFEALALMTVFSTAYVIFGRFCASLPITLAVMYLMLFSVAGWFIDFIRPEVDENADPGTAYLPAVWKNIRSLVSEIGLLFRNPRALLLLVAAAIIWFFYWMLLFFVVQNYSVFVTLILLQLPLILGPLAIMLAFRAEREKIRNKILFGLGICFVFAGVLVHKFSKGKFGFDWVALFPTALLVVLILSNKILRLHLIRYVAELGNWSGLSSPISIRTFFLINFSVPLLLAYVWASQINENLAVTNVQLGAFGFSRHRSHGHLRALGAAVGP